MRRRRKKREEKERDARDVNELWAEGFLHVFALISTIIEEKKKSS